MVKSALSAAGVPKGSTDCGFTAAMLQPFDQTTSNPPPSTECGVAVQFTPPPLTQAPKIFYYATLDVAARSGGHRYAETADAIRRIAGTMDQVSDDVLLKLATANQLSEGLLSTLIAARLSEIGGILPLYDDAKAFFQPLVEQVDQILRRARRHMH